MHASCNKNACVRLRSEHCAHGAQWQELELIFSRLLLHGNVYERRERVVHASLRPAEMFMRACRRSTEALFRVQKCANNHQLIGAGAQRFLRHTCATYFRVIHTRKTPCALRINTQTLIGVIFVHGNGNMHACLHEDEICFTSMDAIFKRL